MAINRRESFTAEFAAAVRVAYARQYPAPVFDDSWGDRLLRPWMRIVVRSRWLSERKIWRLQRSFQGINGFAWSCFRWTEELVEAAVERGVSQYVILGAGFDTFAQRRRDLASRLRVYELDHPATQAIKQRRLGRRGSVAHLEMIPIDFNAESLPDALARSSFDTARPAIVSWLNVIPYLPETSVADTFDGLASALSGGSEVVVNYPIPEELMSEADRKSFRRLKRGVESRGEPFVGSGYRSEDFAALVASSGFAIVAERGTDELRKAYFAEREDDPFVPRLGWRIAHLVRQ